MEPIDAYLRLRAAGHTAFLLDGAGAHPEARNSYVALTPVHEIRVEGPYTTDKSDIQSTETLGNALGHMGRCIADTRFPIQEDAPFTGGWVGILGYEFARNIEPSLPKRPRDADIPDALLHLCLDALAFDRQAKTVRVFCADLEAKRATAEERLKRIRQALGRDVARPQWHSDDPLVWKTSLSQDQFHVAVAQLRGLIRGGDLFQANIATRFEAPCEADPAALYLHLQAANPSPFMALFEEERFALVSGSPEQLLAFDGTTVRSRPIAGTRKRGATRADDDALERELLADPKEQAEHTMLVDLVRNDVAQVSVPGTVGVPERMSVERYRHVMHLVSRVEGTARPGTTALDCIGALFPGGTVTGAPKVRACQRIHEAEPVARGPYTGSAGFISWSGNAHWNILIRSVVLQDGIARVHAGSGIVADSDPEREWKETNRKARALLEAVQGRDTGGGSRERLGEVTRHGSWTPPSKKDALAAMRAASPNPAVSSRHRTSGAQASGPSAPPRVLLIDNYDSFVHNLADYCSTLGADVKVVRNDVDWRAAVAAFQPTHVILSPGPGWPDGAGSTLEIAKDMHGRLPLLGVCLGHQAIGQAFGGHVMVHPDGPVHGKADRIGHTGQGLFTGLRGPIMATRYHSLVVDVGGLDDDWIVDATLADGTTMALRHQRCPTYGLQFHPESLCTDHGLELLARFLATSVKGPGTPRTTPATVRRQETKP